MAPTRVVSTFHASSAVVSSCKCRLTDANTEHLVVAHPDNIQVYSVRDSGLVLECTTRIWGRVLSVKPVPITDTNKSNIVVLLDHPDPELLFLTFSAENPSLDLAQTISLVEDGAPMSEFYHGVLVDSNGELAVISTYQGKVKILQLADGLSAQESDARLPELTVFSLELIHNTHLAILHLNHKRCVELVVRELSADDVSSQYSLIFSPTLISSNTLPFPHDDIPKLIFAPEFSQDESPGGLVVAGGVKILLFALNSAESQQRITRKLSKAKEKEKDKSRGNHRSSSSVMVVEAQKDTKYRSPTASVQWPFHAVTAMSSIAGKPLTWLIGDTFGRTCLLALDPSDPILTLVVLGETSSAETLTYITNQVFYVGSSAGDSKLVKISTTIKDDSVAVPLPDGFSAITEDMLSQDQDLDPDAREDKGRVVTSAGSFLEVVQTFKNLSPIKDAVLVDLPNSRHKQLVTCSGRDNTGSLNVVRMGTEFQPKASIPGLSDVVQMWPLRVKVQDTVHSHVVMTTLRQTYVFELGTASTMIYQEQDSATGFVCDTPTLCVSNFMGKAKGEYNTASTMVVQVTASGVYLLERDPTGDWSRKHEWKPDTGEVVAASINTSMVFLATSNAKVPKLVALGFANDKMHQLRATEVHLAREIPPVHGPATHPASWPDRISCVTCIPFDGKPYTKYVAAAFWHTNQVKVYTILKNEFAFTWETPLLGAPVKSLLFYNFYGSDNKDDLFLLVGLVNGTVACFKRPIPSKQNAANDMEVDGDEAVAETSLPKIVTIGNGPVSLTPTVVGDGTRAVLAAADKAVMISCQGRRLSISLLAVQDVVTACSLNTEHYPNSMLLASPVGLTIGSVNALTNMHIQTIPMGYSVPERIVYAKSLGVYGVLCKITRPNRIGGLDTCQSSFRLMNDTSFKLLSQWNANADELIASIATVTLKETNTTVFAVALYTVSNDDVEVHEGRILLFSTEISSVAKLASQSYQLSQVASVAINGCPFALSVTDNGMLVAAVNASVQLYRINLTKTGSDVSSYSLHKVSEYTHFYTVTSLASIGQRVIVGDCMQAVSVLQIQGNSKLDLMAKDFSPLWPLTVEVFDEDNYIGANDHHNLFAYSLEFKDPKPKLESRGRYHIDDMVSKFVRGSMTPADASSPLETTHFFFTASGCIGIISNVKDEEYGERLVTLQEQTGFAVPGVGGTSHTRYRAPRIDKKTNVDDKSSGFIDGDYIERLSSLVEDSPAIVAEISQQSEFTHEELDVVLESLQNVHL
ncbi:hypothetical protein BDZ89DRAFT_1056185 [Hymenopellis radicata]|nr:hypothetical protein BDZ89DRAFT_1056185 [Hymenopellis radicata]